VGVRQSLATVPNRRLAAGTDTPRFTALVAAVLAALVIVLLLIRDGGDVSRIVHAGPPATSSATAPPGLTVRPTDQAFDGQFFYRLGVSPFATAREVSGVTFDVAALRNARWLYGGLAWLVSAGHPSAVPWALLLINFAAAVALGAVAGALARRSGRHAAWGLLLCLYPGYAYTLTLDTSELVAGAFLLGGLYAGRRGRWPVAAGLFCAAVLTRDTTVSITAGLALGGAIQLLRRRPASSGPLLAGLASVLVFAGWQVLQHARFGAWPLAQSRKANVAGPFTGLAKELSKDVPPDSAASAFRLVSIVVLVGVIVIAAMAMRTTTIPVAERVAWLPAVLVLTTLNPYLWSGATAFMRGASESYVMSTLVLLGDRARYATFAALPVAVLWLLTVGSQLAKG
jgi:hypothetical protein